MSRIKELLKNKKLVAGASLALILVVAVAAVLVYRPGRQPEIPVAESSSAAGGDVTVQIPDPTATEPTSSMTTTTTAPALVVDVKGDPDSSGTTSTREKAKAPDRTVAQKPTQPEAGGVQIGGGEQQEKYSCKTPNHHCINAENHAYIENLELQGCQYCGSHSCKSFYYVSPAGVPICNASICPKYDEKKDPIEYCQACGRKNGDGDNNTCQKWIIDFNCPKCGQLVKANECHTHG